MGRYVTSNTGFEYKYIFGNQSSNIDEFLEEVVCNSDNNFCNSYFSDGANEYFVKLTVDDKQEFIESVEQFIGDFKEPTDKEWSEWSCMKRQFDNDTCTKIMAIRFLEHVKERFDDKGWFRMMIESEC